MGKQVFKSKSKPFRHHPAFCQISHQNGKTFTVQVAAIRQTAGRLGHGTFGFCCPFHVVWDTPSCQLNPDQSGKYIHRRKIFHLTNMLFFTCGSGKCCFLQGWGCVQLHFTHRKESIDAFDATLQNSKVVFLRCLSKWHFLHRNTCHGKHYQTI